MCKDWTVRRRCIRGLREGREEGICMEEVKRLLL